MDISVDGVGGLFAGCNGVNDKGRPCNYIAASKNVWFARLVGKLVDLDRAVLRKLHGSELYPAPVNDLTDCRDNGVYFDSFKLAGLDRCSASGGIWSSKLHIFKLQRLYLAVFADYLNGRAQKPELNSLAQSIFDLLGIGLYLISAAAIHKAHFLRTETNCTARNVDGYITAADDRDL